MGWYGGLYCNFKVNQKTEHYKIIQEQDFVKQLVIGARAFLLTIVAVIILIWLK